MILIGDKEFYKGINKISYEGKKSDNPLAYKYYNPEKIIAGKKMKDHFKFAVAYWHSFCGLGSDPFGPGTQVFEWNKSDDPIQRAKDKADAAFEFITKMGFNYFCFHDVDIIEESNTLSETEKRLQIIRDYIKEKMRISGVKVLWGTANCFSNPIYMNGAATNPEFKIVARAGAQIKMALDTTIFLDGENSVENLHHSWVVNLKKPGLGNPLRDCCNQPSDGDTLYINITDTLTITEYIDCQTGLPCENVGIIEILKNSQNENLMVISMPKSGLKS